MKKLFLGLVCAGLVGVAGCRDNVDVVVNPKTPKKNPVPVHTGPPGNPTGHSGDGCCTRNKTIVCPCKASVCNKDPLTYNLHNPCKCTSKDCVCFKGGVH